MEKKKVIFIVVSVITALLLIGGVVYFIFCGNGYQQVSLKGYSISVPARWQVKTEGDSLFFSYKNEEKGQFSLLYEDCGLIDIPSLYGFDVAEPEMRESDQYATKVYELSFEADGEQILQYVFDELLPAPPYKLVLTFKDVDERIVMTMLSGVTLPAIEDYAPVKPAHIPSGEQLEKTVYSVQNEYGYFAYNVSELDEWMSKDHQPEANQGIHVLNFAGNDKGRELKKWYYLTYDGTNHYLFTYYQGTGGQYIYDNAPQLIKNLKKDFSEQENYSRYLADELVIFEGPYYQDSNNKAMLLQLNSINAEDEKSVPNLVMKALPAGVLLEKIALQTAQKPTSLTLDYTIARSADYIKNGRLLDTVFKENSSVLFDSIENVERIYINIKTKDTLFKKIYQKQVAEEPQDIKNEQANESAKENTPQENIQPGNNDTGKQKDDTRILKSVTVTMVSGSKIKHPETGEMIDVSTYAEAYGMSQYMDQPIVISLHERVKSGKVTMWAAAKCNGKHIGSYPIETVEEFDALVSLAR